MWTNLAFLAALALVPTQSGQLALTNVRTTYGLLGATRPDNKILPGDIVVLSFDIEGAKDNAGGKILYSIGMEVADSTGKSLFKQVPRDLEAPLPPEGKGLPAAASVQVGVDQAPGEYTVKLKVTDRSAAASKELTRTYTVLPKAFGIVRFLTTSDAQGEKAVAKFKKGASTWINFAVVGFASDQNTGQPDLVAEMQVRDDAGRELLSKPSTGEKKKDVPPKTGAVPLQFELQLNRGGKYTIDLKVTDKIAGQSTTLSVPVTVSSSN